MPQIGPLEILVVCVIALIVFGPRRLPEIARSIGRAVNEFRRQASDIRAEFESGLNVDEEAPEPTRPNEPYVHKETTRPKGSDRETEGPPPADFEEPPARKDPSAGRPTEERGDGPG